MFTIPVNDLPLVQGVVQGFDGDLIRLSDDTSHTIGETHLFLPMEAALATLGGIGANLVDGLDPAFSPLFIVRTSGLPLGA